MPDNSLSLHRALKASPEKVYRAFTEANALASWIPPYGFTCTVHEMTLQEGGTFKMSFHNFSTGNGHSFGGKYLEIKPNEFFVSAGFSPTHIYFKNVNLLRNPDV